MGVRDARSSIIQLTAHVDESNVRVDRYQTSGSIPRSTLYVADPARSVKPRPSVALASTSVREPDGSSIAIRSDAPRPRIRKSSETATGSTNLPILQSLTALPASATSMRRLRSPALGKPVTSVSASVPPVTAQPTTGDPSRRPSKASWTCSGSMRDPPLVACTPNSTLATLEASLEASVGISTSTVMTATAGTVRTFARHACNRRKGAEAQRGQRAAGRRARNRVRRAGTPVAVRGTAVIGAVAVRAVGTGGSTRAVTEDGPSMRPTEGCT